MSWKETSLDKCIEFSNGYAFKSKFFTENKNDIPLIKGENLGKGEVLWEKSKYWKVENLKGLERFLLNAGDIILAMDRPYVGGSLKYAMIKTSDSKALQVQRIGRLVAKQDVINEKFLRCVISSDNFKNYVKNIQGGVGVPHISPSQIKNYEFEIPSIQTQKRIADILSAYDDLIENNLKRIKLLEQAAQNIYKEWFVNLRFPGHENSPINKETGFPEGWKNLKFGDVFSVQNGYAFKSKDYRKNGVPVLRTRDYSSSFFINISDPIFLPEEFSISHKKYFVKELDFLLIMVGASIGSNGLVLKKDLPALQNQNQWAIRVKSEYSLYEYFKIYCVKSIIDSLLMKRTGAARDFFRASFIKEMVVQIPNKDLVKHFTKKAKPCIEQINLLLTQNQKLKAARDILLPRLMNRTIEV